jgi:alkyldihydroxyacetonephosphate synthase
MQTPDIRSRRWNGWGEQDIDVPLSAHAAELFAERIGCTTPPQDASFEDSLAAVPASRLPEHALVSTDAEQRLRHARGESFPDWVQKRCGLINSFPDGVAYPETNEQVRELLNWAAQESVAVIPWGGGTSVVSGLTPEAKGKPVLSLDMSRMNKVLDIDEMSMLATIQAGAPGPVLEQQLKERGYILGHLPQSWEYSTIGGWAATRSSGQQSYRYGRIEGIFAGGRVETPQGTWEIPTIPATGAGNDPRELFMGTEGRVGVITEVKARVQQYPEHESFYGVFFPTWKQGEAAVREVGQRRLDVSMLRLSNENETVSHLALAGRPTEIKWLKRYLAMRGIKDGMCYMLFGLTGSKSQCQRVKRDVMAVLKKHGGVNTGTVFGKAWAEKRFKGAYIRNGMWDAGYGIDTFETALDWNKVEPYMRDVQTRAEKVFEGFGEKALVFAHLSHVYRQGSTVYTSCIFRLADTPEETLARWKAFKSVVSECIVEYGGTMSHQHGVGRDHKPWLAAEKGGQLGINGIKALVNSFDPEQMMNPEILVD